MKYSLLISFFVLIIAYPTEQDGAKSPVGDEIIIDGKNETIPDIIDINTGMPPEPPVSTTPKPTISPNTTNSTTVSPTTPTTPPITPTNATTPATTVTPVTNATTLNPNPTNKTTTAPDTTPTAVPTTVKPSVPTTVKPEPERRFDGPSFVGGIVLALGLVAIGFVAFKFYKARTELNYHTL